MNAGTDWNIRSRSAVCQACQKDFVDQQPCHTLLQFDAEGYRRIDLCETCFREHPPVDGVQGAWKGVYRIPPPPSRRQARKEDVETLLRRLVEEGDPQRASMIFVLTVMLERKRIVIERAAHTRADGVRQYVYEYRKTGETFIVTDPNLQIGAIDDLEQEVAEQLAAPAPEPAAPAPDTPAIRDEK